MKKNKKLSIKSNWAKGITAAESKNIIGGCCVTYTCPTQWDCILTNKKTTCTCPSIQNCPDPNL